MNDVITNNDLHQAVEGLCVVQYDVSAVYQSVGQQVDCCVYKLKTINTLTACF